jgi:hypothetical protein
MSLQQHLAPPSHVLPSLNPKTPLDTSCPSFIHTIDPKSRHVNRRCNTALSMSGSTALCRTWLALRVGRRAFELPARKAPTQWGSCARQSKHPGPPSHVL